jgi:hypothetical protein
MRLEKHVFDTFATLGVVVVLWMRNKWRKLEDGCIVYARGVFKKDTWAAKIKPSCCMPENCV